MNRFAVVIAVLVSALPAQDDAMVKAIIKEGSEGSRVMAHLNHLTNKIGPRLTSSDRLNQAADWAVAQFKSWGLDARKEQWGTMPVGFNRGPSSGWMLEPERRGLTFSTSAWSAGTTGKQKGDAVLAPKDQDGVEALGKSVAGKWVVHYPTARGRRGRRGGGNQKDQMNPAAFRRLGELCRLHGALGTITTSGQAIVRTSGRWRIKWDDLPTEVRITLVKDDFDAIVKSLKGAQGSSVVLSFDIRNWFKKGPIPLYNVIADLKGSTKPDEYVVIGGHLDSWDGATGTTDNGTGSSTTLEAARILATAGAKPKRTIRFMLWSGEEQGLLGSAAWCKKHQAELDAISGCFVHDGGTNYVAGVRGTPTQQEQMQKAFVHCKKVSAELEFNIGETGRLSGGGSDHGSYLSHGIPGYFWSQKGKAVYTYGWHTQNDTYDLAVPKYQKHSATVIALGALGVANLDKKLDRTNLRSTSERARLNRNLGLQFERGTLKVSGFANERGVGARSGIKKGDVLMQLDGVNLKGDRFVLRAAANNGEPKKKLVVHREGKPIEINVSWRR